MDIPQTHDRQSRLLQQTESRMSKLIKTQFRFSALLISSSVVAFLVLLAVTLYFLRQPAHDDLIDSMESSSAQLEELAKALASEKVPKPEALLDSIERYEAARSEATRALRQETIEPSPVSETLLQVIGSALIVALLGALGLQRLQNIDAEVNNLRESLSDQVEERAEANRALLDALVDSAVGKRFESARNQLQELQEAAASAKDDILKFIDESRTSILAEAESSQLRIKSETEQVARLLEQYPWLKQKKAFEGAIDIASISSVNQAHELSVRFNLAQDSTSAIDALNQILDKSLPGTADDFHNAHTEAMKMAEFGLGLSIVEAGLTAFPDHYDLIADKVKVLPALGRAEEARTIFEEWHERKPSELTRSWRPVTYYTDTFQLLELSQSASATVLRILQTAVRRIPHEVRVWSAYAKFLISQGRMDETVSILKDSLEANRRASC